MSKKFEFEKNVLKWRYAILEKQIESGESKKNSPPGNYVK